MVDVHIAVELQEAPAWRRGCGAMFVTAAADKLGARGDQEGALGSAVWRSRGSCLSEPGARVGPCMRGPCLARFDQQ